MILNRVDIQNYKNVEEAHLAFSPNVNCLIGNNGMGKTNILDAIYYLSFCRSSTSQTDASVIRHDEAFMMLKGHYTRRGVNEEISMALQRGKRKIARRGAKEYKRLSEHIGMLPIVMVSPTDWDLIRGSGEARRRLMYQIISQGDHQYLEALINYGKALEQRNAMLKQEINDRLLYESVEHTLCTAAATIHAARKQWAEAFVPTFTTYYNAIADSDEQVQIGYQSHLNEASMEDVLEHNRQRDLFLGYTSAGVHRDDLELMLNSHPMRTTASQGQCKTYTVALRLAQYDFLKQTSSTTPILLLDDIFDRLDARRVERIIDLVSTDRFGQIFITDTNRAHIDEIMQRMSGDHALFAVDHGHCQPVEGLNA